MFEWLAARSPLLVYSFLIFNSLFESLFPPYPSDAFVLVFAFLAGRGGFNPYIIYLCTVIGSIAGIMILYYIGKEKGDELLHYLSNSFLRRVFPVSLINKAKLKLAKRGNLIGFLNRFLPGMRAPLCFAAGIVKLDSRRFFFQSLVSVLLWNLFLVTAGFYVGSTWDEASRFLRNYNITVTLVLLAVLLVLTVVYFRRKRRLRG
ncbi:MAG TPA: DedA family protein [candidate division WOR-3 bacterium]|uniref:DedA family protein n=1 Tax=candidate division WOR-3 bacterium TaxID=2052148 RepID=A0A9C9ELY2_UNCW3|nr:DedA family protein [candidate division WOR-3 bacterium]